MKRIGATFGLAIAVLLALPGTPAHASWVSNNCYVSNVPDSHVRRADAKAYAQIAIDEGYEWGGGCWDNDNRDDTPGQPNSGGEGPDCSGFVFKSWELRLSMGTSGFTWWNRFQNVHGPYTSTAFHSPQASWPFVKLPDKRYSTTMYMDAFAKDGHIGMIYGESQPQDGTDTIVEALGDAYGTGLWIEAYRGNGAYAAIRREAWTPDCYPNCREGDSKSSVVVP
jgi:hypothetical protein